MMISSNNAGLYGLSFAISFLQLICCQTFTFSTFEWDDKCTTATISFEVQPRGSFSFSWYARPENTPEQQLAVVTLKSAGNISVMKVSNTIFSPEDYDVTHTPTLLPEFELTRQFRTTLLIRNLNADENLIYRVGVNQSGAQFSASRCPNPTITDLSCCVLSQSSNQDVSNVDKEAAFISVFVFCWCITVFIVAFSFYYFRLF